LVKSLGRKLILIDGNSLVYRAFFALPTTLTTPSGQVSNAVYGFTSMLIRLLIDERPDAVAVAFDSAGPTWRHGHYEGYKANRQATPDELRTQFPLVKEVLAALAIPIFELPGHEADDLLATLTNQAHQAGDEVLVVTGDRDAFQLIGESGVRVMTTRRGITDIVIYDRAKVIERYGVTPEQVPDFLGLKGDPSDSIPGVPGVGDKTAAKLVQQFGSVEGIYDRLDEVGSDKLRGVLATHRDQAEMSKQLAVLNRELPVAIDMDQAKIGGWDEENVRSVFSRLEFRTLLERFETKLAETLTPALMPLEVDVRRLSAGQLIDYLSASTEIAVAGLEIAGPDNGAIAGLALAFPAADKPQAVIVESGEMDEPALTALTRWLNEPSRTIAIYDLKNRQKQLEALGLSLQGSLFDPLLAAYLLAPADLSYDLEHLAHRWLERRLPDKEETAPDELLGAHAAAAMGLVEALRPALDEESLFPVFNDIEIPLSRVLARMETYGVGLDRVFLSKLARELADSLAGLAEEIYLLAGEEFNINSPQQVGQVLFDKLGLTPGRKTKVKAAYATDAAVLAKLAAAHPIVPLLLEYRELTKLKSTYIDALPKLIDQTTGRIHTTFNQTVTATGRLSSSNPNLQNIPTRTDLGRRIRQAFVPAHRDEKLLAADYSQIELRLLAEFSGDEALKDAFKQGVDIHTRTAAEVFEVGLGEVTTELRRYAKAVNFGIIYGMSAFGLAEQLGISQEAAKDYIVRYFRRYPAVEGYLKETVAQAYRQGYVTTISGRRRYLPELQSANFNERSFGERVATNAPLQGSAADIIKLAMINIDNYLSESGLQTRMVLQVHDELIFEVPPLEESAAQKEIKRLMENAYTLSVPLEVNLAFGRNWGETK
jgi:DNA polymerase I